MTEPSCTLAAGEPVAAPRLAKLSVIIPNYNYGRYVATAIDSALGVDWPSVEVIVVDDGSTDQSWEKITSYGDRIRAVRQENSGPRVACNTGFALSHGDVVIFLDSDDVLRPSVMQEVADAWYPGVSKVQYPMQRIDGDGRSVGSVLPIYRWTPSPRDVRRWIDATGEHPTPPGSGNAYSRDFLEALFPLGPECGDATDSACLVAAPYLGDVVTLDSVQAEYRVHGDNRSLLLSEKSSKFPKYIERAIQRHRFALRISHRPPDDLRPLRRGLHLLQLRIAALRLDGPRTSLPDDSRARVVGDSVGAAMAPSFYPLTQRMFIVAWVAVVAIAPRPMAARMIRRRFTPAHLRR